MISAQHLRKALGSRLLLDDVSFALQSNERVGLVGGNGSGKSTLAKILAGREELDAGEVHRQNHLRLAYLDQDPTFAPGASARQAVAAGLGDWLNAKERYEACAQQAAEAPGDRDALLAEQAESAHEMERLGGWERMHQVEFFLEHLGVRAIDETMDRRSGGEKRRVALARLLVEAPDFVILDEPTNHLDRESSEWLEYYLGQEFKGGLLLITHDRYLLDRLVDRTLELDGGKIYSFSGGWQDYLEQKAERMAHAARAEANRQNFLRRELEWLRSTPKARTGKAKARIQRAESAIAQRPQGKGRELRLRAEAQPRLGNTILELRDFSLAMGERRLIDGFDFDLREGERIGILGPNGSGKTSLLRALLGELQPSSGRIVVGPNTRFAYLSQARDRLRLDASVRENVAEHHNQVIVAGKAYDVRGWLEGFGFNSVKQVQKVGSLSGGERARVALVQLLLTPANVLLLDEPTNDLDVDTLSALEGMLVEEERTALIVTHDRYFLDRVATGMLAFEKEAKVVRYAGNYSDALAQRKLALQQAPAASEEASRKPVEETPAGAKPDAKDAAAKKKTRLRLTYAEERELETLLDRVAEAEEVLSRAEAELADPALYVERPQEVTTLEAAASSARQKVEELVARWEALESKRQDFES